MGGAERAQRKRKQRVTRTAAAGTAGGAARTGGSARQRGSARPGGSTRTAAGQDRRRVLTAAAVVLVLAAAVVAGVLWQRSRSAPPTASPQQVDASYPVRLDNGVVVAGADTAKVTADVYEDFLCPACGSFEKRDGGKIDDALEAGTLKVRYHIINLLDDLSNPPGYSLDAAAAAHCAASAGAFPSFHASLYASQPREGGRGYSLDQLVQLGRDLGITDPAFDGCVRQRTHAGAVRAQLNAASTDPALRRTRPGGGQAFGTPTVVVNGKLVDHGDPDWLDNALRSAAG